MGNVIDLVGRLLIAAMFFIAGLNKIASYQGTLGYMKNVGLPGELLPSVIGLEIIGPVLLVIGWLTQLVAIGLAIFCILTAYFFHFNLADQMQVILLLNNVAIAGGLLILAAHGPGGWSIDNRR